MKKLVLALAAIAMTTGATQAASRVEVGRLSCNVEAGVGLLVGSSKDMVCKFIRKDKKTETYDGRIDKVGLDIGFTGDTRIEWIVFSASNTNVGKGSLAGTYVGGSGEATFGVGVGSNWLIGGSNKGFALQPFSVQAQTGVDLSVAFAKLTLF
jgi:Protein of unknown function (DUF992)